METLRNRDHPIRLHLAKSGLTLHVPADRSILEVLTEHGFDIDSICREGICGTCETRIVSGTPDHRDSVLDEDERRAGETMMICVSRALSDELVIDL